MLVGGVCYRTCCVRVWEWWVRGRGAEEDLIQGFSPLNLQLRVSPGLPEERRGMGLPCLSETGQSQWCLPFLASVSAHSTVSPVLGCKNKEKKKWDRCFSHNVTRRRSEISVYHTSLIFYFLHWKPCSSFFLIVRSCGSLQWSVTARGTLWVRTCVLPGPQGLSRFLTKGGN